MSVFSEIIAGQLPGRFVWADDVCVAFATIEPVQPGHVLIVPRVETDIYVDVAPDTFAHMANVAQIIGKAQMAAFGVVRPVMSLIGFDVPHTHIHVMPANVQEDIRQKNAKLATDEALDAAMTALRVALIEAGHGEHVPPDLHSPKLG
ncbi:MAG: HIT family protein [Actinomycetaceae bacterium]|nr:HIT family protein [Arcanobacterium sp.]MDD7687295.1 HIT family protein [Actinomycetaceae bacterium]MDY5273573.1 HIT family protein [Arcanobacterium sp.]